MKRLGGFFGFESKSMFANRSRPEKWKDIRFYGYARHGLMDLLQFTAAKKVYLSYYICDSVLEALQKSGVSYQFLPLNKKLQFKKIPRLKPGEYLYCVNYFGLQNSYVQDLSKRYRHQLIIDDCQNLMALNFPESHQIFSYRKWMGVENGAGLRTPLSIQQKKSVCRLSKGYSFLWNPDFYSDDFLYAKFLQAEKNVPNRVCVPHPKTVKKIQSFQYKKMQKARKRNFEFFMNNLKDYLFPGFEYSKEATPFCFPIQVSSMSSRSLLFSKKIYIPTLWLDVLNRDTQASKKFKFEKSLVSQLWPIPIDHRLTIKDCKRIVEELKKVLP